MKKLFCHIAVAVMVLAAALDAETADAQEYKLWYGSPAKVWTDALPIGNGRLGAMVYGTPATERIQLNEETIWTGGPNSNANPEAKDALEGIQNLIWKGEIKKAQDLCGQKFISRTNHGMAYQTFGDVYVSAPGMGLYQDYYRELSLDSALTVSSWKASGITYRRETIASLKDNVIAMHFTADKPGKISFTAHFATPHEDVVIRSDGSDATMQGTAGSLEGQEGVIRFIGRMRVQVNGEDAFASSDDGVLSVVDADDATLYITIATNFVNWHDVSADEVARSREELDKALTHSFEEQKAEHIRRYSELFGRNRLSLGEDRYAGEPTDRRIVEFASREDNHLVATYYAFGRYLLICSSQPDTQAANLQGIWNDRLFAPWDSKYTTNVNLEMNYWPAEPTNLPELAGPLFSLIRDVSKTGAETARTMYGKGGWVLHHNTDIWRVTGAIDYFGSGMWMTAGAWLSNHLWQHYLYSGDREFLQRSYPIMKGAAEFLSQMLVAEPENGYLVISPSVSPENSYSSPEGPVALSYGTTMDNELLYELFQSVIEASRILGEDADFASELSQKLTKLAPLQIGSWGQLQEWIKDWDNPDDTHRHVSHLYALYPGNQISPYRTPELCSAVRTSLIHRGDPSTGWSMGWKVCLWARLLDGNHAYKLIHDQLTLTGDSDISYGNGDQGGTYRNLFDAHPPFQIDGNFGCTAGISEMLVQSHDGAVSLLPALPDAWKAEGSITGVRTRGGFVIEEMSWKDGRITTLRIRSTLGGNLRLRVPQKLAGRKAANRNNSNPLFSVTAPAPMLNHSCVELSPVALPKTWTYDVPTKAGETITFRLR